MKKLIIALIAILVVIGGGTYGLASQESEKESPKLPVVTKGLDKHIAPQCPATTLQISEQISYHTCTNCHVEPTWQIKEFPPTVTMQFPSSMRITGDVLEVKVYGEINRYSLETIEKAFEYLEWHSDVKTVKVIILSGGGSLFSGWQMLAKLESMKGQYHIITHVPSFAASAAFLLWMAGEERTVHRHALLMHHELWTFDMFKMEDVSDAEENARVKRLIQDNIHDYLVGKSILTKKQLDEYVRGERDYWMSGEEAKKVGFATKLIGE